MSNLLESPNPDTPEYFAANYCISFIDLLGQREAFRGQGLLPTINGQPDKTTIDRVLQDAIIPTHRMQQDVEDMIKSVSANPASPLRMSLSEEDRALFDEMQRRRVETQYWSDGFVRYVCLGDEAIMCPLTGVNEIFQFSGYFCLLGLAQRHPVRGAIDIAWGSELPHGGLCGPVVANAYELESEVAQYPRIVVSQRAVEFFEWHIANPDRNPFTQLNRTLA